MYLALLSSPSTWHRPMKRGKGQSAGQLHLVSLFGVFCPRPVLRCHVLLHVVRTCCPACLAQWPSLRQIMRCLPQPRVPYWHAKTCKSMPCWGLYLSGPAFPVCLTHTPALSFHAKLYRGPPGFIVLFDNVWQGLLDGACFNEVLLVPAPYHVLCCRLCPLPCGSGLPLCSWGELSWWAALCGSFIMQR